MIMHLKQNIFNFNFAEYLDNYKNLLNYIICLVFL